MEAKEMVPFDFEGDEIRTITIDGQPWWVAADVCRVLKHTNNRVAMQRLDDDERGSTKVYTLGGMQTMQIVNESGLYSLILRSNLKEAKKFRRWITHVVLPEIRKTGGYFAPRSFAEALQLAANQQFEIEARNREIAEMRPVVQAHEVLTDSKSTAKIRDVAKVLGYGQNKFFQRLRDDKILDGNNVPYQRYIDAGYFIVKDQHVKNERFEKLHKQTFVTAKGESYLAKKYGSGE